MTFLYCVSVIIVAAAIFAATGFISDTLENISDRMYEKRMIEKRRTQGN